MSRPVESLLKSYSSGAFLRHLSNGNAGKEPTRPGLGDRIASGLSAVGITKERAQAVAKAVGIQDCGCQQRQAALNDLGYRLGVGTPPPAPDAPAG